ncbi:MAG TPA: di-heme oxidoredictase family protein, partial [Blastocatellia bacterium]|nr:di-heme oxidoredictase family protein [Blastocatellia bacterium]
GGMLTVPPALGSKTIHPFSDFLLHNVGTGDGVVQNGGGATRNKLRTTPLWGLRTRNQFMHDGQSLSLNSAILRHAGEAQLVTNSYRRLRDTQKTQLITFLRSL